MNTPEKGAIEAGVYGRQESIVNATESRGWLVRRLPIRGATQPVAA
jgi:hypothetical protein